MKYCYQCKCIRLGLGLTQKEFGEIIGVSSSTICRFEDGKEINDSLFRLIKYGIDNHLKSLSKEKLLESRIKSQVYSLEYETKEEKCATLNYMAINIAKLGLLLMENESD